MSRPQSALESAFVSSRGSVLGPGVSFADYVEATASDPQPGERTLLAVREAAFTGEVRFAAVPSILVYADHGVVYHAERAGDPTLTERLVTAGVVTREQLNRGVIEVGGQDHLGRLFDRDTSVDRAAVVAHSSAHTDSLVAAAAALPAASVTATEYRHHPSGVHRWFVGPADVALHRPPSDVAQVDRSVVEELPEVTDPAPEIRIVWYDPDLPGGTVDPRVRGHDHPDHWAHEHGASEGSTRTAIPLLDDDLSDDVVTDDVAVSEDVVVSEDLVDEEDVVVSEDLVDEGVDDRHGNDVDGHAGPDVDDRVQDGFVRSDAEADERRDPGFEPFRDRRRTPRPDPVGESISERRGRPETPAAAPEVADDIGSPPGAAPGSTREDVPADVADAVRRALDAIEGTSAEEHAETASRRIVIPPPPPPPTGVIIESAPAPNGFAPPTADMRADVVYARAVDAAEWDAAPSPAEPTVPGRAATGGQGERRGALRRLIDSLRRSD